MVDSYSQGAAPNLTRGDVDMNERGMDKLHSLLFRGEGELVNVKFFPGRGLCLTRDELAHAGADMIRSAQDAWKNGTKSNPPRTNIAKTKLVA